MKEPTPRVVRAELVIATLALLVSSCASVAALIQTRATVDQTKTIAEQYGASVWPYVTFDTLLSPSSYTFAIDNQGLGPALIRSFSLAIDGRSTRHWRDAAELLDPHGKKALSEADVGTGSVLRPGQTFALLTIGDPALRRSFVRAAVTRIVARVCYCSLLGDCWTLASSESEPAKVSACTHDTGRVDL